MSFTDRAGRLAGQVAVLLGWRPADFWAATPAELASVLAALAGDGIRGGDAGDLARLQEMFPDG